MIFHTCDSSARGPHVLCVLRAHDVIDVSSCLFWIVGEKEPARLHNKIQEVNKQAAFAFIYSVYATLTVSARAVSFLVAVMGAKQR